MRIGCGVIAATSGLRPRVGLTRTRSSFISATYFSSAIIAFAGTATVTTRYTTTGRTSS